MNEAISIYYSAEQHALLNSFARELLIVRDDGVHVWIPFHQRGLYIDGQSRWLYYLPIESPKESRSRIARRPTHTELMKALKELIENSP